MKLTMFLLLLGSLTAIHANQLISLTGYSKSAPLGKVFKAIEKQTGYYFSYNSRQLRRSGRVTFEMNSVALEQVLWSCFKDQPLTYTISDNIIVGNYSPGKCWWGMSHQIKVKRRVVDENGEPVTGNLDKVQVIPYYYTGKRFNTGNINTVRGVDIQKQPVSGPLLALEGKQPMKDNSCVRLLQVNRLNKVKEFSCFNTYTTKKYYHYRNYRWFLFQLDFPAHILN